MSNWLGGGSLTVEEEDGSPSVANVTKIQVSNATLTDDGAGTVSMSMSPSGGANTALSNLASVAVSLALTPGTDNSIALNSAAKRYTIGYFSTGVGIYKAASDANPTAILADGALNFGAGGASAVSVGLAYSAAGTLKITDGSTGVGNLAFGTTGSGNRIDVPIINALDYFITKGNGGMFAFYGYSAGYGGGISQTADGVIKVFGSGLDPATNGNIIASSAITAVGTAAYNGVIRTGVYKRAWTNAEVVAFGAVLTGDLKVATLPAKTIVRNACIVIDSQAAGTTTLTVSLGRTAAAYIDYIVASDAKVAANTLYGDGSAERGTNLTGYDLPAYAATTDVYVQFIATVANLDQVTTCTGTIYITTEVLP